MPLYRAVAVILHQNLMLIKQIPEGQIMGGLHEFPFVETGEGGIEPNLLIEKILSRYQLPTKPIRKLAAIPQSFTRYQVRLDPILLSCRLKRTPKGFFWATLEQAQQLPFSSGHRKILNILTDFKALLPTDTNDSG